MSHEDPIDLLRRVAALLETSAFRIQQLSNSNRKLEQRVRQLELSGQQKGHVGESLRSEIDDMALHFAQRDLSVTEELRRINRVLKRMDEE